MPGSIPAAADSAEVNKLIAADPASVRLVDVRTGAEFGEAHIPGSRNVPLTVLRRDPGALRAAASERLVLVCASGARAQQARDVLASAGIRGTTVLSGGISAWERDGGRLDRRLGGWSMERQVRLVAGVLVLAGVLSSMAFEPLKWLAGFIGAGLTFAALSNTCAMARVLALLPFNRARRCDC